MFTAWNRGGHAGSRHECTLTRNTIWHRRVASRRHGGTLTRNSNWHRQVASRRHGGVARIASRRYGVTRNTIAIRSHGGTLSRYINWRWRGESGGVKRVICRSPNETELSRLCACWVYGTVDFVSHLPDREKIETKPRSVNHILHTRHNVLRVSVFIQLVKH